MSVETELRDLLSANGFTMKKTKMDAVWTMEHPGYKTVNFLKNGLISFNYLGRHMRDLARKRYGSLLGFTRDERERMYREQLATLPFFGRIEPTLKFTIRMKNEHSDYMRFSENVGMDVFRQVVKFIVSDAGGVYTDR